MNSILMVSVVACGPQKVAGIETGTSGGSTTTVPTSGAGSTGGGTALGGTGGSVGSTGSTFIVADDMPVDGDCDTFEQDCPAGQKCSPYANDGGTSWNDARCVPVMEDPAQVGEECFVVGNGVSGIDSCEAGAMCWDVDPRTNMGTCVALCTGAPETPMCEPGFYCVISAEHIIILCLPFCDPLAGDCPPGDVCVNNNSDGFGCVLDASGEEGQVHDHCQFTNTCDPGLFCAESSSAEECDQRQIGCCEPFCDLTSGEPCPGNGQVCQPWWPPGEAPAGYEDVGFCAVPR